MAKRYLNLQMFNFSSPPTKKWKVSENSSPPSKLVRQAAFSCGLLRDVAQDDSSSRDLEMTEQFETEHDVVDQTRKNRKNSRKSWPSYGSLYRKFESLHSCFMLTSKSKGLR